MGAFGAMAALGGGLLGSVLGGSAKKASVPDMDFSGYDKAISGMNQYTGDINGMSEAGLQNQNLYSMMQGQQDDKLAGQNQSNAANAMSNASMYGVDAGAAERMGRFAQEEAGDRQAEQNQQFTTAQQQNVASDIGMQDERKYDVLTNKLPNAELSKMQALNDHQMGIAQMNNANNQASASRTSGLFNTIAGVGMKSLLG